MVFDARADGFARGEGCAAGVLSAGCPVARVAGSAVRQDGRSASLTAPNGRAQKLLFDDVLHDAGMASAAVPLLEAAANGSPMGDAIEAGAISGAMLGVRKGGVRYLCSGRTFRRVQVFNRMAIAWRSYWRSYCQSYANPVAIP